MKKTEDIFSDTVDHDIKSLIMSIKAYSQLLVRKAEPTIDASIYQYIIRLDEQTDALIRLIKTRDTPTTKEKK